MKEKIGVVDVGGGMRGVYAAGVLDYCMDNGIRFDLGIGVSAGSANLASYIAGQPRRNYRFYTEYAMRREYMGLSNLLHKKNYFDLDYVYSGLSNADGEDPLDYPAIADNPMEFLIVATEAETGEAKYFDKSDISQDNYDVFKASSAIPAVCEPYPIEGVLYYDGALADPVPIQKAFDLGCDRVALLLTRPENKLREPGQDVKLAKHIQERYPKAAEKLLHRADRYNEGVALARRYQAEGKAFIIAPEDTCGINTISRKKEGLKRLYEKGYQDGALLSFFLF
jgi:predicted patatin/cPLA2 family phospholipase